ncbi:MAG: hypothetical protein ACOC80_14160, partial [Petrotogales bacterium]
MKPFIIDNIFDKIYEEPYEISISKNSFGKFVRLPSTETEPEKHEKWTDIYIVLEGEASLVLGEDLENAKDLGDGEFKGGEIVKPNMNRLRKGSIAVIPSGYPHKLRTGNNFAQLV